MKDDEPYIQGEYQNGYLQEMCRDSIKAEELMPKEKKEVLDKMMGDIQYYLFYLGNQKNDHTNNVITKDFSPSKG